MKGKTVSQANRLTEYRHGMINFLYAPVGAGKTFYFLKTLPEELGRDPNKGYVFIAPYRSIVDQSALEAEAAELDMDVKLSFEGVYPVDDKELMRLSDIRGKVLVTTAQGFFSWVNKKPDIWNQIEVLIVDECDAIEFEMANYSHNDKLKQFKSTILTHCDSTLMILTTATRVPQIRNSYAHKLNEILFEHELRHFVPKSTQSYTSIEKLLTHFYVPPGNTSSRCGSIAIYCSLVKNCLEIKGVCERMGLRAALLVSENADKYKMNEFDLRIKQSILENGIADTQVLIFNDSFVRGINITDKTFERIVVHSRDEVKQTQAIGRLRFDNVEIWTLGETDDWKKQKQTKIQTGEFDKTEIENMILELDLRNSNRTKMGITNFKKWLEQNGYELKTKRKTIRGEKITIYKILETL